MITFDAHGCIGDEIFADIGGSTLWIKGVDKNGNETQIYPSLEQCKQIRAKLDEYITQETKGGAGE